MHAQCNANINELHASFLIVLNEQLSIVIKQQRQQQINSTHKFDNIEKKMFAYVRNVIKIYIPTVQHDQMKFKICKNLSFGVKVYCVLFWCAKLKEKNMCVISTVMKTTLT